MRGYREPDVRIEDQGRLVYDYDAPKRRGAWLGIILSFLSGIPAVAFMRYEQHLYALAVLAVGCVAGLYFAGTLILEQRRRIRLPDVTGETAAPTRARIEEPREDPPEELDDQPGEEHARRRSARATTE